MTRENIYLGKRVPDIAKPGLDSTKEVSGICKSIVRDYKSGRISYKTAMSRLNLMELIIARDSDFTFNARKERQAREIVEKYRKKLMSGKMARRKKTTRRKTRRKKGRRKKRR